MKGKMWAVLSEDLHQDDRRITYFLTNEPVCLENQSAYATVCFDVQFNALYLEAGSSLFLVPQEFCPIDAELSPMLM